MKYQVVITIAAVAAISPIAALGQGYGGSNSAWQQQQAQYQQQRELELERQRQQLEQQRQDLQRLQDALRRAKREAEDDCYYSRHPLPPMPDRFTVPSERFAPYPLPPTHLLPLRPTVSLWWRLYPPPMARLTRQLLGTAE